MGFRTDVEEIRRTSTGKQGQPDASAIARVTAIAAAIALT
jgi:hypothetical protein